MDRSVYLPYIIFFHVSRILEKINVDDTLAPLFLPVYGSAALSYQLEFIFIP